MSWMQKLYETYEACAAIPVYANPPQAAGDETAAALMPVSHVSQQAHIQVTIDGEGRFVRAELLPVKTSCVIPATEDSAGRSGQKPPPHPLDDKIRYCAGDYAGNRQRTKPGEKTEFESYVELLRGWCASPQSHPMARAVLAYVEKGTLVHDLAEKGVLCADDKGELLNALPAVEDAEKRDSIFSRLVPKKGVRDQGEAFVVWNVLLPGETECRTWENRSLREAWAAYDATLMQKRGLCLVQGEEAALTFKHPRNIRRPGDGAKLISSNDNTNFTYRGRFGEPEQACAVGYEVSQKAHSALRWLIQRQGWRNGEQVVVAWAVSGAPVPHPCEDFFNLSDEDFLSPVSAPAAIPAAALPQAQGPLDMGQAFALRLDKALAGYHAKLEDTTGIAIMAMEAASPGRLSVTFYREQFFKDYLEKLAKWQRDFAWPQPVRAETENAGQGRGNARTVGQPMAPLPKAIARTAYGQRCDDKLLKATVERLLPCIVDGAPLPRDLVESCIRRAVNRAAQEPWEWNATLAVACALYRGWSIRTRKKEYGMALDENNGSRDYLYGRLLAVAEYIERTALNTAGENRPTNAERLMQRFADQPCNTWLQIEKQLQPYMQRLQGSDRAGLLFRARKMLDAVMGRFRNGDFTAPGKLGGEFLLGYHCQRAAMYAKSDNNTSDEEA